MVAVSGARLRAMAPQAQPEVALISRPGIGCCSGMSVLTIDAIPAATGRS